MKNLIIVLINDAETSRIIVDAPAYLINRFEFVFDILLLN